jgi:hypothetical protein
MPAFTAARAFWLASAPKIEFSVETPWVFARKYQKTHVW